MVKQDRARRTHALVLDAAATEFAARGFAATNLHAVVRRTGLTRGALYGHFASKAELAAELTRQFEQRWRALLTAAEGSGASPLRVLDMLLTQLTDRAQHDVRFSAGLRLVTEKAWAEGTSAEQVEQLRALLLHLVVVAQDSGGIDPGHKPEALSQLFLAVLLGLHHTVPAAPPERDGGNHVVQTRHVWRTLLPAMCHPVI
ncbi:TetR family transcriptional regulator [Streptomyces sp. ISL-100]|uniref:TetR family transcriptional regulator n=1 Tax=Streptomyces sp. ISL-100 TaxID=2819173 RepID=UPI001BE71EC0|nr:TetR family transcriptional regulator [Streptomyces sp. ISL-100]MBT2399302.1 TetR/AcrR family transcriptional regulator [Streptomyces sp. ISL-100]